MDNNGEVVAPVTAQDFVDALQYVLTPDYASSNVGLVTAYIAGANDYYNYHVYLTNAENGTVDDDGTTYVTDGSGNVTVTAADGTASTYAPVDFDSVGVTAAERDGRPVCHQRRDPVQLRCFLPVRLRVSGNLDHEEEPREL